YLDSKSNWAVVRRSIQDDEFCLDPTRMTLVCGTAGFDGTQFKGILANKYNIQLNKTSRNSVLLQSNITSPRSDRCTFDPGSDGTQQRDRPASGPGRSQRQGDIRCTGKEPHDRCAGPAKLLAFHEAFRKDAGGRTNEGLVRVQRRPSARRHG